MKRLKTSSFILILFAMLFFCVRIWPREGILADKGSSTALFDKDGNLLRITLAGNEVLRVFVKLEDISKDLIQATLLKEDRYFYFHPGVNPIALSTAAIDVLRHREKRGASTITMQVARMLYHLETRTGPGKLKQILYAIGLELRYSKQEILEAYLNLAPYGGNLEGVGSASLIYFGKKASALSLSEAITLSIIPQNPASRDLFKNNQEVFKNRFQAERKRIYQIWQSKFPTQDFEKLEWPNIRARSETPFLAPHFSDMVLRRNQSDTQITTTLDLKTQKTIEEIINLYLKQKSELGIHNASVALLHYPSMELRALVGSANYFNKDIAGQVSGYLALRSPGSTLKPFVYALGMDQGLIHDYSILKDTPVSYGGFDPENYDSQFSGPISVHDALIRSRNIPAVGISAQLQNPDLFDFMRTSGIRLPFSKQYYGLGLALGGAEISMENLLSLYSVIANEGELRSIRYKLSDQQSKPRRLLSRESSHLILSIMQDNPRPNSTLTSGNSRDQFKTAWKTGTSHGYRDAWSVGIFGPYVLAVWFGDFNNKENPAYVGRDLAGPLFFRIAEALYQTDPSFRMFDQQNSANLNLQTVEICPLSGKVRGKYCPGSATAHFIPGTSPIHTCDIHRRVAINPTNGLRACREDIGSSFKVFEFWPTDIMKTFAAIGLPRNLPPKFDPACGFENRIAGGESLKISSPRNKVVYKIRLSESPQPIAFRAATDSASRKIFWYLDQSYLGSSDTKEVFFWIPRPGRFLVKAVDEVGHSAQREMIVESIL